MLTILNPKTYNWAEMPLSDCYEGNAADSYFTLKLYHLIMEKLGGLGNTKLLEQIISPVLPVFAEMEFEGLDVDMKQLSVVGKQLKDTNIDVTDSLYEYKQVSNTQNLSSNNDLIDILYTDEKGFALYPPDMTPTGKPSVSAPTLKLLLDQINAELIKR